MKSDIQTRADIELLVDRFYDKIKDDKVIGYFFTEIAQLNWTSHLPRMYDFWENIVFHTAHFEGNPMLKHFLVSRKSPMQKIHFDHWCKVFSETVNEYFRGENANLIIHRAISIAQIMQSKIVN